MREDVRATMAVAMGFVIGVVATSYLVFSDPDVRSMFRVKSDRMRHTGWSGFAKECARMTVLELRDSFPQVFRKMVEGTD